MARPQSIYGFVAEVCVYLRHWCRGNPPRDAVHRLLEAGVVIAGHRSTLRFRLGMTAAKECCTCEQLARSLLTRLFLESGPDSEIARAVAEDIESDDMVLYNRYESVV